MQDLEQQYFRAAGNVCSQVLSFLSSSSYDLSASHLLADYDIKVLGDSLLNNYISRLLLETTGLPVVSEENIDEINVNQITDCYYWLIDPIDGSANYSRGLPFVFSSLALIDPSGFPVLGFVIDLLASKVYSASCGKKSIFDLNPLLSRASLSDSFAASGFPLAFDSSVLHSFVKSLRQFRKVRMYGSAVGSLMLLLNNQIDVYVESGILPWDIAGSLPLINSKGLYYYLKKCPTSRFGLNVIMANSEPLLHSAVSSFKFDPHSLNTISFA